MQNSRSNRQKWLTVYRFATLSVLAVILAFTAILVGRSYDTKITSTQADKVAQAASYLQTVGFNNPVYTGITRGEGEYPTFRATAIGGEPVELWIRTTRNGGLEIQPSMIFHKVASAEDFARIAEKAVFDWNHMPPDVKPRTDGAYGEYESRKYSFDQLSKYNPPKAYWDTRPDEVNSWPQK
jgi:hypothetical protein